MDNSVINEDYIALEDALKRIGGNMKLYKQLLKRFTDSGYMAKINEAIQNGNTEEALQHAHALKGVSANLSLIKIQSITAELEGKLKEQQDYSVCLSELEQAYAATEEQITTIFE